MVPHDNSKSTPQVHRARAVDGAGFCSITMGWDLVGVTDVTWLYPSIHPTSSPCSPQCRLDTAAEEPWSSHRSIPSCLLRMGKQEGPQECSGLDSLLSLHFTAAG